MVSESEPTHCMMVPRKPTATWTAGDRMPGGVSAVQDRLGLTWVRWGKFWRVKGANGHDVTWNYLVNNRSPLTPTESASGTDRAERRIDELIEASSLGAPSAKAARESVSDEDAQRIIDRVNQIRPDGV